MATPNLHTFKRLPQTWPNRIYAIVYALAILALFYRHFLNLMGHTSTTPILISVSLILADFILAALWVSYQAFRVNPIRRDVFPENLPQVAKESEYPGLDVFICTADPYMEPPMGVVNTALSVLAYDYPVEKLSVYVSDDGGSQLTLFAFMEAAEFAKKWLPYCKKNNIMDRSPEVHFGSSDSDHHHGASFPETNEIKLMYKKMKAKVEKVVENGSVCPDDLSPGGALSFSKWAHNSTRHDHPPIIEVLLEKGKAKDADGKAMPNLIYVSREKRKDKAHNFKAGALNVLLRVSTAMTNAPIFLTLDCDMYSNDPKTPLRSLCYFLDPNMDPKLGFVQFPQRFHGINENDIYGAEFRFEARIDTLGFDGLLGPHFHGTGAFFRRRALVGSQSQVFPVEFPQVSTGNLINGSIQGEDNLKKAHQVASCNYEDNTKWGLEMGFRYGCLVEDIYTSYHLHCLGWKSIFCNPDRAAFLGNSPINLLGFLTQTKRWYMGLLQISLSKYSPITFGIRSMNTLQALCYANYTFRPISSIPIIIYAFIPQLALMNSLPIFPKVSDPWIFIYAFLFLGAYGKTLLDFMMGGEQIRRWWSNQRMWMIWGLSSFSFASLEYFLKSLGISTFGFNVTSKVIDHEQRERYEKGIFEFGVASPMFLSITTAATMSLFSFVHAMTQVLKSGRRIEELFVQIFIAGFVVVNSWPIYEAMILRIDEGKMPRKITVTSIVLAWVLYMISSLAFL